MYREILQAFLNNLVEDLNAPEVLGIAVAVRGLSVSEALEDSKVLLVELNVLEVGDDARLSDGLGDDTCATLLAPSDQHVGVVSVVLCCNL